MDLLSEKVGARHKDDIVNDIMERMDDMIGDLDILMSSHLLLRRGQST